MYPLKKKKILPSNCVIGIVLPKSVHLIVNLEVDSVMNVKCSKFISSASVPALHR
jgi:hypothetical protein